MTTALWIIAVVETIRMIEQSLQLRLIARDKSLSRRMQTDAYDYKGNGKWERSE